MERDAQINHGDFPSSWASLLFILSVSLLAMYRGNGKSATALDALRVLISSMIILLSDFSSGYSFPLTLG